MQGDGLQLVPLDMSTEAKPWEQNADPLAHQDRRLITSLVSLPVCGSVYITVYHVR
jgi:hypothetical protein